MKKEKYSMKLNVLILIICIFSGCGPKTAYDYYNRAEKNNEKNKTEEAIQDYTEAIRLDPSFTQAYVERGRIYLDKGNTDLAINDFNEASKLHPDDDTFGNFIIHKVLGDAYSLKGEWNLAILNYQTSLQIDPDNTKVKEELEKAKNERDKQDKEKFEQRLAWYTEEIRKNPNNADLYFKRGYVYVYGTDKQLTSAQEALIIWLDFAPQDWSRAISDWKMALKINPNHVLAKEYLKRAQEMRGY